MAEERMPTPAAGFLLVTQEYNHQKPWFGFHSKKKKGQAFFGRTSLFSETMFHQKHLYSSGRHLCRQLLRD